MLRARDEHQSQCRQIRSERPAGRPATPRRRQRRPELEFLEDRRLLSTYYVQNTNDSGPGSLRWAIEQGNDDATPADIFFNIPASDSPLLNDPVLGFDPVSQNWTITLLTPLPVITNTVWIDGYTQAHAGIPFRYPNAISSAVQQVAVTGGPTGGTFTLTTSAPLPIGTATIPYDANAATVRAALGTIVGPGNVTVQGGPAPDSAFTIAFQNAYAAMDIPDLVAAAGGLTGGTNPGVLVETQIPGGLPTDDPKFITSRANARDPLMGYDARIRLIVDGSQLVGATG
ncbi:MAG: hypothetical protein U0790_13040, partial [Isosphaeraceae bacterium]